MLEENFSSIFMKWLFLFGTGIPIIAYSSQDINTRFLLAFTLGGYIILVFLGLIFIGYKKEPFLNKLIYVLLGFWMALISFGCITGFFSLFQAERFQVGRFLIAVFLGISGIIVMFYIGRRTIGNNG